MMTAPFLSIGQDRPCIQSTGHRIRQFLDPFPAPIRKFLREKDLKKHLKGKKSIENVENEDVEEETKKEDAITEETMLQKDLDKDNQLNRAVSLLTGWEIMQSYSNKIKPSKAELNLQE